jgi:hypothetical protein
MNQLFRIIVLHGAPKDSHTSTETYLVAKDETEVFEWIDKQKNYSKWTNDDEGGSAVREDEDTGEEVPFRDWVMKNKGDLEDQDGWEDSYYGVTKFGWEPVEATTEDIAVLIRLGIAVEANPTTTP